MYIGLRSRDIDAECLYSKVIFTNDFGTLILRYLQLSSAAGSGSLPLSPRIFRVFVKKDNWVIMVLRLEFLCRDECVDS